MSRPRSNSPRSAVANVRLTEIERTEMERCAIENGHRNLSEYIRFLHATAQREMKVAPAAREREREYPRILVRSFHNVGNGEILLGDSRGYLFDLAKPSCVDLVMTSPPFGLVRKKDY